MKNYHTYHVVKALAKLKSWSLALALLFVMAQTAGLLHAEIHPFHEHDASCDVFDKLAQPFDSATAAIETKQNFTICKASVIELTALYHKSHIDHFYGRAPPLA